MLRVRTANRVMRVALPSGGNLAKWKHGVPRNRMRETFTSGSVGGLVEQSPILPGQPPCYPYDRSTVNEDRKASDCSSRHGNARTRLNFAFGRESVR